MQPPFAIVLTLSLPVLAHALPHEDEATTSMRMGRMRGGMMMPGDMSGRGGGMMRGHHHGAMAMGGHHNHMRFMEAIHSLMWHRDEISRQVNNTPSGVSTRTHSHNPAVARWIQTHVAQMKRALEQNEPLHRHDPLFRAIFAHHEEVRLNYANVSGGVLVEEDGLSPCARALVQSHAQVVSSFLARGHEAVMAEHPVPSACDAQFASSRQ